MKFIYHLVPKYMVGEELVPLNQMRNISKETYEREIAKYSDHPRRSLLPSTIIPKLNCWWNDVVFFSPLHPYWIYKGWRSVGYSPKADVRWFAVPIRSVQEQPVALYHDRQEHNPDGTIPDAEIELLLINDYRELTELPLDTLEWYRTLASQGRIGAHFHKIPHVLVQGSVDVSRARIISWDDSPHPEVYLPERSRDDKG